MRLDCQSRDCAHHCLLIESDRTERIELPVASFFFNFYPRHLTSPILTGGELLSAKSLTNFRLVVRLEEKKKKILN